MGSEPDPRFTLANERTFLAWIRTSLALMAGGIAVAELLDSQPRGERLLIAVPLVVIAAVIALCSYGRWNALERALRLSQPLPRAALAVILAGGVGCVALLTAVVLVVP